MIKILGPKDKDPIPKDAVFINTTSHSKNWSKGLSPFYLGPCKLYDNHIAKNVENAWQFSKVYKCHADEQSNPTEQYWQWAKQGWSDSRAHRYPMGKGAIPEYSWWNGKKLGYVEARHQIYIPLYYKAVKNTDAYKQLREIYQSGKEIFLWDFDGFRHDKLGMTLKDVANDPNRKMGHAFVLAKMLEKGI